ncbi:MAG TPA: efflux RND transporter periplasmic adaptor subunit [Acidiphilium sp.]|nr:MAG: hypothetical protein B7Z67_01135 [Acidiphilium sp. 21-60-14]OYV91875.1 MAG: hypothetical protein B7Z57_03475 [Acidiphilium sp. 37-60-79]HQT88015.1 efflux RND transporter periplasmic adaptor subunit [Acidiphilium sp.]HQU23069.1 efflux RND transporter periplasmic adaptor subunit [Acidiphilium sp.]
MTRCFLALWFVLVPIALASPPRVLVSTIPVKSGAIDRGVTVYGTIGAGPGASDTITMAYAGIVTKLDVLPGLAVRRGQALAVIGTAPSAQAAYAQAEAAVRAARQNLVHTRTLLAAHLATAMQLTQAEQAEQAAIAVRGALRLEGSSRAMTTITAPYDGVVAQIAAAPGAAVMPGAALMTIVRADDLVATVGLDSGEARAVRVGDPVTLLRVAHAVHAVRGRVSAISAMVNPQTGLVDATISMDQAGFLVGESVTAKIDIGTARGVIVPRDAALPHGRAFQLWQVANGHARAVDVQIIARTVRRAVVTGPIDPALPIVVSGNYQLKPGMAVRIDR